MESIIGDNQAMDGLKEGSDNISKIAPANEPLQTISKLVNGIETKQEDISQIIGQPNASDSSLKEAAGLKGTKSGDFHQALQENLTNENVFVQSFISDSSSISSSTASSCDENPLCGVCKSAKRQEPASKYCITCGCLLCGPCTKVHQEHSPDNDHVLVRVSPETIHAVQCKTHTSHLVRVFCLTCNLPVCKVCLSEKQHSQHHMSDFTSSNRPESVLVRGIGYQMQNQLKELRLLKSGLSSALEATEINRKETNNLIISHINEQIEYLQEKKQELVDGSDAYHREVHDHVSKQVSVVERATNVMTNLQTRVDTSVYPLPPHGHVTPEIFPMNVIQKLFTQIRLPQMLSKDFGTRDCYFENGTKPIPGMLHAGQSMVRRELITFNDAEIGRRKVSVMWNKSIEAHDVHFFPNKTKDILCTDINKGYKLLKLKIDGKLSALPVGLSGFSGRECVVGVNQWTGHKVIVYKPESKSSNIVLTMLTDDEDDVDVNLSGATLPAGNTIVSGVALSQKRNIIVTSTDDPENPTRTSISCYNSKGQTLWQRNTSPSSFAGDLANPAFVVTDQLDRIIITDSYGGKVNIYTSDGSHLLSFPQVAPEKTDLKPTGVCVDLSGRILVAFHDLQAVALFTSNGGFIRHLVQTEGQPWGISLSQDRFLVVALEGMGMWLYDLKRLD